MRGPNHMLNPVSTPIAQPSNVPRTVGRKIRSKQCSENIIENPREASPMPHLPRKMNPGAPFRGDFHPHGLMKQLQHGGIKNRRPANRIHFQNSTNIFQTAWNKRTTSLLGGG
ncbi:hypothetical protein FRC02_006268, partial [Tulasnella sp. 418]